MFSILFYLPCGVKTGYLEYGVIEDLKKVRLVKMWKDNLIYEKKMKKVQEMKV